ncbi:hypothetical protein ABF87_06225 [Nitrosomonas sp. JL21]|uniref:YchJ family protein n=1 Tax=Nitrosomonas sp. JL21 TaxID=153949 RepID=UPI001F040533|nr:YchJ family metal-binding protein [Nitrosomonas sp. JL21]MXS77566.1 hypothetical protein [Nitrosomonas sp. JL21]
MAHQKSDIQSLRCPCGAEPRYIDCCGRFLDNGEMPDTAEILMRSRYTAYTLHREKYLLATWHPSTCPSSLELTQSPTPHWLGLTVKRHLQSDTDHAIVEFVARYKLNGKAHRLHEISRFIRENHAWRYIDGDILEN